MHLRGYSRNVGINILANHFLSVIKDYAIKLIQYQLYMVIWNIHNYVTGSVKTLHVSVQILTHFGTLKYHNSLTVSCNVVEICILVDK